MIAALVGSAFLGTSITPMGFIGVILGFAAIFMMSIRDAQQRPDLKTVLLGLGSGLSFAMTSLLIREGILHSGLKFPINGAFALVVALLTQVTVMVIWMRKSQPNTLKKLIQYWPKTLMVGICGGLGSCAWFSAYALQDVAYVKTLGQVEVFFTLGISAFILNKKVSRFDYIGLLLIGISSVMVIWDGL